MICKLCYSECTPAGLFSGVCCVCRYEDDSSVMIICSACRFIIYDITEGDL